MRFIVEGFIVHALTLDHQCIEQFSTLKFSRAMRVLSGVIRQAYPPLRRYIGMHLERSPAPHFPRFYLFRFSIWSVPFGLYICSLWLGRAFYRRLVGRFRASGEHLQIYLVHFHRSHPFLHDLGRQHSDIGRKRAKASLHTTHDLVAFALHYETLRL